MMPTLYPVLSRKNRHPRDKYIKFFDEGHKYVITSDPDNKYTSVTSWNHTHFPKFDADEVIKNMTNSKGWKEGHKYWGQSPDEIKTLWDTNKEALAGAGTNLHYEIECFNNDKRFQFIYTNKELYEIYMCHNEKSHEEKSLEWKYYINFIRDFPKLKPYRSEWLIYDDDAKIAGSIDMVYENQDGTLSIYDWKRSKSITKINNFNKFAITEEICHIPDANFWHYALQLNTYKFILEEKYGKIVKDLFLVRLHPNAKDGTYELLEVPNLRRDVSELFEKRIREINQVYEEEIYE